MTVTAEALRAFREDRSIVTLLDADYTFVDERLADHYGIADIHGSYFRRVTLDAANPRRGILGEGAFLTVSSVGTRTSPVTRGRWILENLLGTPAPIPPPGVDTNLEKNPEEVKNIRQVLEAAAWKDDDPLPIYGADYPHVVESLPANFDDDLHSKPEAHRQWWNAHVFCRARKDLVQENDADADQSANSNQAPIDVGCNHALRQRRNQTGLRSRQWMWTKFSPGRADESISMIHQVENRRNDERARDDAEDQRHLLPPGRRMN